MDLLKTAKLPMEIFPASGTLHCQKNHTKTSLLIKFSFKYTRSKFSHVRNSLLRNLNSYNSKQNNKNISKFMYNKGFVVFSCMGIFFQKGFVLNRKSR